MSILLLILGFSAIRSIINYNSNISTQAGGLIGILRNLRMNKKQKLRILVLGLDNAGKTTIQKSLSSEMTVVGIRISRPSRRPKGSTSIIQLMTNSSLIGGTSGTKSSEIVLGNYFNNTDALVYVIDSADTKRVKEAGEELEKLLQEKELGNIPLLIFFNKQDILQAPSTRRGQFTNSYIFNNLKIENEHQLPARRRLKKGWRMYQLGLFKMVRQ